MASAGLAFSDRHCTAAGALGEQPWHRQALRCLTGTALLQAR